MTTGAPGFRSRSQLARPRSSASRGVPASLLRRRLTVVDPGLDDLDVACRQFLNRFSDVVFSPDRVCRVAHVVRPDSIFGREAATGGEKARGIGWRIKPP
jgi:hypothetical protein